MSFMDLLASRKAKLGGKYLLPSNDTQPLVGAETAADMEEEEVDMVELREEEMVNEVNEEEVREVVDDSKEKDKGKKSLKRSLTSIVKKLKSKESDGGKIVEPVNGTIRTTAGFMRVGQCEEVEGEKIVKKNFQRDFKTQSQKRKMAAVPKQTSTAGGIKS